MRALATVRDSVIKMAGSCLKDVDGLDVAFSADQEPAPIRSVSADGLSLHPRLTGYLTEHYPDGLFLHQRHHIEQAAAGQHSIATTRTSSGKTLSFHTVTLNAFLEDPRATSLYIYPQKALANDQFMKLKGMFEAVVGHGPASNLIARYDGATPNAFRPAIRREAQFVLTNPDMLHLAILQYHDKWARFFSNLRYVVVDEAHEYRGIFGSSVAYILRRLRCVCEKYGSKPVFISASATINDPVLHLRTLTGLDFVEIGPDLDGSFQGPRKLWLIRGALPPHQLGRVLTRKLVDQGLNCLTFCPGRMCAEKLVADLPDEELADGRVRVYRAGLSPQEREEIEAGMKTGQVRGVFSTSALELGIDIGALDVMICVGLPSTMMSFWQRAGRVGRGGREGAIIFIAADTPIDTYYCEHPKELLARPNEPLAVNLENRRLVCHHLACAIQEAGDEDALPTDVLGEHIARGLELRKSGRLGDEVFYSSDPHVRTPVRNGSAQNYHLMLDGEEIGSIDPWHLIREAYPQAIYLHGGRRYRVTDIFRSRLEIRLVPEKSRNYTQPHINKKVYARRPRAVRESAQLLITKADLEVVERLVSVQEKAPNGQTLRHYDSGLGVQPHRLPTEGVLVEVKGDLIQRLDGETTASNRTAVVKAIERLLRSLFPVVAGPCDVTDYDTFSRANRSGIAWVIYDQVYDGIGLAVKAFPVIDKLFRKALDRVEACDCDSDAGCFRCVRNPDQEDHISKADCIRVLRALCETMEGGDFSEKTFHVDVLEVPEVEVECPACKASVRPDDKFCSDCGEKLTEDEE